MDSDCTQVMPRTLALRLAIDEWTFATMLALAAGWVYLEALGLTPRRLARRAATVCGGAAMARGLGVARTAAAFAKALTGKAFDGASQLASRLLTPWRQPVLARVQRRSHR